MQIHIITIGSPKLAYAKLGWTEYYTRLMRLHTIRATHIADKNNNLASIQKAIGKAYTVALMIDGTQLSSPELAQFLDSRAIAAKETCFIIGGPEGLPAELSRVVDYRWSLGTLTLPHDLAMVVLLESLYRATTISRGTPYHK